MKYIVLSATLISLLFINFNLIAQDCYQNIGGNLSGNINLSSIINCPNGDVVLDGVGSHPSGNGNIIFDTDVTFNSITINFVNGNKPAEFIIPVGVTVTILTDLNFTGQPDKDKFLTVNGELIVGGTLDFGDIQFEIDGSGKIDAGAIEGATDTSCTQPADDPNESCPLITADECEDGGSGFCASDVQPIELLFFNASISNQNAILSWATSSEENFDYFAIERSHNGKDYEEIARIKGIGWSREIINYGYTDNHPLNGKSYYRLKAVDLDATFEYFHTVMVQVSGTDNLRVLSNPIEDNIIKFQLNFTPKETISVVVTDISGMEVFSGSFEAGLSQYVIEKSLNKGLYLLKVSTASNIYTTRFLKK